MKRWWAVVASAAVYAAGTAHAETWHTYAAFGNDVFTEVIPPIDDQGFTHDNVFSLVRRDDNRGYGGRAVQRWITSNVDRRRWDQLDIVALAEQHVAIDRVGLVFEERVGPTLGGNFGGQYLQNGWHTLTGTGPTVDEGLQNDYRAPGSSACSSAGARERSSATSACTAMRSSTARSGSARACRRSRPPSAVSPGRGTSECSWRSR